MLKKFEAKCKRCRKEFCRKRTEQELLLGSVQKSRLEQPQKASLKASRRGYWEASKMALFLQQKQVPANHPIPLIWGLLFERRSLLKRTIPIRSASPSQMAPREGSGSPATGTGLKDHRR